MAKKQAQLPRLTPSGHFMYMAQTSPAAPPHAVRPFHVHGANKPSCPGRSRCRPLHRSSVRHCRGASLFCRGSYNQFSRLLISKNCNDLHMMPGGIAINMFVHVVAWAIDAPAPHSAFPASRAAWNNSSWCACPRLSAWLCAAAMHRKTVLYYSSHYLVENMSFKFLTEFDVVPMILPLWYHLGIFMLRIRFHHLYKCWVEFIYEISFLNTLWIKLQLQLQLII